MIIDFESIDEKIIPQFKGGEKEFNVKMHDDGETKIMCATLKPGASIGFHKHTGNCEIIYILSGRGKVIYDDGEESIKAGQAHYCPVNHSHSLINNSEEELTFFACVPKQ